MYLIDQLVLIYILKEFPAMGISYEMIERNCPYITEMTMRNYVRGKTKPKGKKFDYLTKELRSKYPMEYKVAKDKFRQEQTEKIKGLTIDELKQLFTLGL